MERDNLEKVKVSRLFNHYNHYIQLLVRENISGGEIQSPYVAVFSNFQFLELFQIPLECSFGDQLYYQDYTNCGRVGGG